MVVRRLPVVFPTAVLTMSLELKLFGAYLKRIVRMTSRHAAIKSQAPLTTKRRQEGILHLFAVMVTVPEDILFARSDFQMLQIVTAKHGSPDFATDSRLHVRIEHMGCFADESASKETTKSLRIVAKRRDGVKRKPVAVDRPCFDRQIERFDLLTMFRKQVVHFAVVLSVSHTPPDMRFSEDMLQDMRSSIHFERKDSGGYAK